MLTIEQTALDQLSALLLERAGLKIPPEGYHSLKLALSARMPALGIADAEEYVRRLKQLAGEHELRSLLPLVTVGKTEFFRDARQFRAMEKRILPDLMNKVRAEQRKLKIWSAGCATGEEPYSVAMVLAESGAKAWECDLLATDVNPAAVENARGGRYAVRRMVGMTEARLRRHFKLYEDGYEVSDVLREYVRFEGQNLAAPVYAKIAAGSLDLILCRNVIIYFDLPTIRGVMDRFLAALRPGGHLLLGYSESLFKVYDKFEMVEVEGAFVYRKPLAPREPVAEKPKPAPISVLGVSSGRLDFSRPAQPGQSSGEAPRRPVTGSINVAAISAATSAYAATLEPGSAAAGGSSAGTPLVSPAAGLSIAGAGTGSGTGGAAVPAPAGGPTPTLRRPQTGSVNMAALAGAAAAYAASLEARPPPGRSPAERLDRIVHQMERGDFEGALTALRKLIEDEPNDLDALLTLGNLCSLTGRSADAVDAFAQAVAREPLCVEARIFGGVAALQIRRLEDARSELSKALFLEPTLAMGHYLLAQVHERSGDRDGARRSYRNALAQLRFPQRPLAGHYPDMPETTDAIGRAARYALAALEEG